MGLRRCPRTTPDLEYLAVVRPRRSRKRPLFGELGYRHHGSLAGDGRRALVRLRRRPVAAGRVSVLRSTSASTTATRPATTTSIFKFNTFVRVHRRRDGLPDDQRRLSHGRPELGPPCPDPIPDGQTYCLKPDEVLIKPDTTTNYEVGLRSLWLDGRLLLNAAVYYIDWNDIQVRRDQRRRRVPITVNGGTAETKGVELTTRWSITDSLELAASMSFNEPQLTSDAPGLVDGADAFDGDRLAGTPEQQGTLLLDYTRPLDNGWTLEADYSLDGRRATCTRRSACATTAKRCRDTPSTARPSAWPAGRGRATPVRRQRLRQVRGDLGAPRSAVHLTSVDRDGRTIAIDSFAHLFPEHAAAAHGGPRVQLPLRSLRRVWARARDRCSREVSARRSEGDVARRSGAHPRGHCARPD